MAIYKTENLPSERFPLNELCGITPFSLLVEPMKKVASDLFKYGNVKLKFGEFLLIFLTSFHNSSYCFGGPGLNFFEGMPLDEGFITSIPYET